jgi:hypothetical protein
VNGAWRRPGPDGINQDHYVRTLPGVKQRCSLAIVLDDIDQARCAARQPPGYREPHAVILTEFVSNTDHSSWADLWKHVRA